MTMNGPSRTIARHCRRFQSTYSAMSSVSAQYSGPNPRFPSSASNLSSLDYRAGNDFSTAVSMQTNMWDQHEHLLALLNVASVHQPATAVAHEMDLIEAAHEKQSYDKILILVRHGEGQHDKFERQWASEGNAMPAEMSKDYPRDPLMSPRGVGQVLNLSRRTALFCNSETNLIPELVVVSPLRRSAQAALLTFPDLSPGSIKNVPWVCHASLVEHANGYPSDFVSPPEDLEAIFPGIDYSMLRNNVDLGIENSTEKEPMTKNKTDLLKRTDAFLDWLRNRPEQVVFVSSHATWLQSFCGFTLQNERADGGREMFKNGEMRILGVNFDR